MGISTYMECSSTSSSINISDIYKRINKDKQHIGVVIDMRRSKMIENILLMLKEKVIFIEELEDFSNELKEEINYYLKMYGRGTM